MRNATYLKRYEFENYRVIGICIRFKIHDSGSCVSQSYKNLEEAEQFLEKFVTKTLGISYENRTEL